MQKEPTTKLWLPGQGVVDLAPMRVSRAVQAYDERLIFGRINEPDHPGYGDWCIFVKMPLGHKPEILPVLGFGKEMPTPEEAVRRADEANTRKHGAKLLDQIMRQERQRQADWDKENERLAETYADVMKEAKGVKNPQISTYVAGKE